MNTGIFWLTVDNSAGKVPFCAFFHLKKVLPADFCRPVP